jgi:hypothetical protein
LADGTRFFDHVCINVGAGHVEALRGHLSGRNTRARPNGDVQPFRSDH